MSDDDALHVALRLKALADPARVKIMSYLFSSSSGEENSGDLAALGLTESTVSHHLTQLRRAGLVQSERLGMNVYPGHTAMRWARYAYLCTQTAAPPSSRRVARTPCRLTARLERPASSVAPTTAGPTPRPENIESCNSNALALVPGGTSNLDGVTSQRSGRNPSNEIPRAAIQRRIRRYLHRIGGNVSVWLYECPRLERAGRSLRSFCDHER